MIKYIKMVFNLVKQEAESPGCVTYCRYNKLTADGEVLPIWKRTEKSSYIDLTAVYLQKKDCCFSKFVKFRKKNFFQHIKRPFLAFDASVHCFSPLYHDFSMIL